MQAVPLLFLPQIPGFWKLIVSRGLFCSRLRDWHDQIYFRWGAFSLCIWTHQQSKDVWLNQSRHWWWQNCLTQLEFVDEAQGWKQWRGRGWWQKWEDTRVAGDLKAYLHSTFFVSVALSQLLWTQPSFEIGSMMSPHFTDEEAERPHSRPHRARGLAGILISAVWLQSLYSQLPHCTQ